MKSTSPMKISFGYGAASSPNRLPSPQTHSVMIPMQRPPHSFETSHVQHVEIVRS